MPALKLNCGRSSVDSTRNGGTQSKGSDGDTGANDGQDQSIFGRSSARFVANEGLDDVKHVKTPLLQFKPLHPPLRKTDTRNDAPIASISVSMRNVLGSCKAQLTVMVKFQVIIFVNDFVNGGTLKGG